MGHPLQSLYLGIVPVRAEDVRMCDYTSKERIQWYSIAVFFCYGNSANVFFSLLFLLDGTIKLALRAEMSDFQQSFGRCPQFKLPLCNFNSAAVSCMTCASPIPGRRRIRSGCIKSSSPPHGDDSGQTERENARARSRARMCIRGAISVTEVQSPASQRGKTAPRCRLIDPSG